MIMFFFLLYLYDRMDVSWAYCNHFTMYANQTIILYAWNIHSDVMYVSYFLIKLGKEISEHDRKGELPA